MTNCPAPNTIMSRAGNDRSLSPSARGRICTRGEILLSQSKCKVLTKPQVEK